MYEGEIEFHGDYPKIFKIPTKVTPFLFRNNDLYYLVKHITYDSNKVVQVFSMPGLGKSSLVRNATNYVAERGYYVDGILYLNVSRIDTF